MLPTRGRSGPATAVTVPSSRTSRDGRTVPELHQAVLVRRGDAPAVGAERRAIENARMTPQGDQLLAGRRVPELDRLIPACRGDPPAVGAERHAHGIELVRVEE